MCCIVDPLQWIPSATSRDNTSQTIIATYYGFHRQRNMNLYRCCCCCHGCLNGFRSTTCSWILPAAVIHTASGVAAQHCFNRHSHKLLLMLPPLLLLPSRGTLAAPNAMCAGTASPGMRNVEDTDSSLRLPGCTAPPIVVAVLVVGLQAWARMHRAIAGPAGRLGHTMMAAKQARSCSSSGEGIRNPGLTVPAAHRWPSAAAP